MKFSKWQGLLTVGYFQIQRAAKNLVGHEFFKKLSEPIQWMTKQTSSPKKTFGTASSLQKTELEGARYSGSDEVLVIIKIFKLFSRPYVIEIWSVIHHWKALHNSC